MCFTVIALQTEQYADFNMTIFIDMDIAFGIDVRGLQDLINEDCEHVAFHKCATDKNKMRMFLNPNQVIRYSHYK